MRKTGRQMDKYKYRGQTTNRQINIFTDGQANKIEIQINRQIGRQIKQLGR